MQFFFQNTSFKCSFESRRGDNLVTSHQGWKFSARQIGSGIWEYVIFHSMSIRTWFAWQLICLINCCRSSVCTINPLISSSKCANIDPGRHYHTTLASTVGPQRRYEKCSGLLFQVGSLNHHIILNFIIISSSHDGYELHPSGKAVTPDCLREDDGKKKKKSIYTPRGEKSESRQKVPRAPLNQ